MDIPESERQYIIGELRVHLKARLDGGGRNLICRCPFCGKEGKFGIYVGARTDRKEPFIGHCFSCGKSLSTPQRLFESIGRSDLIPASVSEPWTPLANIFALKSQQDEIDDELSVIALPDFYRRCFSHPYLQGRGFTPDDFEYFPVGTTHGLNRRWDDYVIFPIIDDGDTVGYVGRHTWPKKEIDEHNRQAKLKGGYKIMRYRNSVENDFVKLLYNYDAVVEERTDTVILVEGIFDVVSLVRKLDLYDDAQSAVVATFGKKISATQIYKLQSKGVASVIIGYDGDAVEAIKKTAAELSRWFDVRVADIADPAKDWEDLSVEEVKEIFSERLLSPFEYKLWKVQEIN